MRALLISHDGVTEVDLDASDTLHAMYDLIDCRTVCGAGYPDQGHACWADDEGLFHIRTGTLETRTAWYPEPLVGNLLVTGIDAEGETTPATLTLDQLRGMIRQQRVFL